MNDPARQIDCPPSPENELVLLCGEDRSVLLTRLNQLRLQLKDKLAPNALEPPVSAGRNERLAIVAPRRELIARLDQAAERLVTLRRSRLVLRDRGIYFGSGDTAGRVAFLFPGQGSQRTGMLREAYARLPSVRAWFDALDEAHRDVGEASPTRFIFPRSDGVGEHEDNERALFDIGRGAQLCTVANLAMHELIVQAGIAADFVLGHSNGEHAAVMAACMDPARQRERICAWLCEASKAGFDLGEPRVPESMAAVSAIDLKELAAIMARRTDMLFVAMDNCPHQQVIAGHHAAVMAAGRDIVAAGGACGRLPFTRAYHTPLFAEWAEVLSASYGDLPLDLPRVPIFSCLTGAAMPADLAAVRAFMAAQWTAPVRFREAVAALFARGVRTFVEIGAGATLSAFVEDTLRGLPHLAVSTSSSHRADVAQLQHCLAALHAHGVPIDARRVAEFRIASRKGEPIGGFTRTSAAALDSVAAAQSALIADARAGMARVAEMFEATAAAGRALMRPNRPARKAGPLLGAWRQANDRCHVAERRFARATDPMLADHSLGRRFAAASPARSPLAVLAFTTSAAITAEAAALFERDGVVVLSDVRARRWLALDDGALTLRVEAERHGSDFRVGLFERAGRGPAFAATIALDAAAAAIVLPADPQARPPTLWTPQSFYSRYAFHGPSFQGLSRVSAVGPRSIAAELTVTTLPGLDTAALMLDPALLDCAGQLAAFWLLEYCRQPPRFGIFPYAARRIALHGRPMPPGTRMRCRGEIVLHDDLTTDANFIFIAPDGRTIATVEGLRQRLISFPEPIARWLFNGDAVELSEPDAARASRVTRRIRAADWPLLIDQDGIWQRMLAHLILAEGELRTWATCPPAAGPRLDWLLERIVAKEAVREWASLQDIAAPDVSEIVVGEGSTIHCPALACRQPHLELRRDNGGIVAAVW